MNRSKSIDILRAMSVQLLRAVPEQLPATTRRIQKEEVYEAIQNLQRVVTEWTGYGFTDCDIKDLNIELLSFYTE